MRDIGERSLDESHVKFISLSNVELSRRTTKPKEPLKDFILEVSNVEGFQTNKQIETTTKEEQKKLEMRIDTSENVKENPVVSNIDDEDEDKITKSEEEFDVNEEFQPPQSSVYQNVENMFQKIFPGVKFKNEIAQQTLSTVKKMLKKLDSSNHNEKEKSQLNSDKQLYQEPQQQQQQQQPEQQQQQQQQLFDSYQNTFKRELSKDSNKDVDKPLIPHRYKESQFETDPKSPKTESVEPVIDFKTDSEHNEINQDKKMVINKYEKVTNDDLLSGDPNPVGENHSEEEKYVEESDRDSFENEFSIDTSEPRVDSKEDPTGEKELPLPQKVGERVLPLPQRISEAINDPERVETEKEIRTIFEIFSRRRKTSFGSSQCSNISPVGVNVEEQKFHPDRTQFLCEDADFFDHFRRGCIIYSFAVNGNWDFEKATADRGCKVWVYDMNVKEKPSEVVNPNIFFFNYGLGTSNEVKSIQDQEVQFHTLEEIIRMNSHNKSLISYMKMNLYGEEWQILDQITEESSLITNNILQMGLTLHLHAALDDHYLYSQYLRVLNKLFGLGYQLFTSKEVEIENETYKEPLLDDKIVALTNYLAFLRV